MKRFGLLLFLALFSNEFTFAQSSPVPVDISFPQIAVGGDPAGLNYVTIVQLVNNNSAFTTAHIALYSDTGTALPVLFDGQGTASTIDVPLKPGQTRQIQVTSNGPVAAGWMQITYSPSDAQTTVILQFRSAATLLSEVGVDPTFDSFGATDFAAETGNAVNTGIAVANPNTSPTSVLATLWDSNSGAALSSTIISLLPGGHVARFLNEIFPSVANIAQIRAKLSLDSCAGPSCNSPGGVGFVATALRLNGDQFTAIPVAERPPYGAQVRILPQVAFGGPANGINMRTILYLTTNSAGGLSGTAEVFDDDGNPLSVSADDSAPSPLISFTVPANGVSRIVINGDENLRSGWIRITLPEALHLVANALFQTFNGSSLVSEASVLESSAIDGGLIYVTTGAGSGNIGLAFANAKSISNTISVKLFDQDGFVAETREITLPPNGHLARFVTELFPNVAAASRFDGAVSFHSSSSVSAVALRLNGETIATLPLAANGMYRPAITALRITQAQRSPAQVNFEVDVTDFDSDVATAGSSTVMANVFIDFGNAGYDLGPVTINGTGLIGRAVGTLSGSFPLPHVTGTIPSGTPALFYIHQLFDASGNESNAVRIPVTF
jgi:hypothetical protein